ncbi:MAG: hypothetical protein KAS62_00680, partial [Candidatus Delongbacteria bacterium]|nr:hypothetical protein [Candidatus Delongbacteria bacterium]
CSQKYDETGIFDAQDPNFFADTLVTIAEKNTIVNSLSMIQDDFLYIGADIGTDTTAYGEILFNFELFNTDSTLDSAFIMIPVLDDSLSQANAGKTFDIFKVNAPWDATEVDRNTLDLTLFSTSNFYTDPDSNLAAYSYIKINLDPSFIETWFTGDSLNTSFNGFLIRSTPGDEITPIMKLYSSRWGYESLLPQVHRFTTDTLLAHDGVTDTLVVAEAMNNLLTDLSFVKKESACLDTSGSEFKIGGISGEGIVCKIELDSIPSNATIITGRFEIDHDSSDPTYGDIRNSYSTANELCVYKATNSAWTTDVDQLEYDTLNVWTYKIEPLDSATTLMVADAMMQEWVTDPATNHGFYITSKNWGQPFGYMVFDSLKIKVSYIITTGD